MKTRIYAAPADKGLNCGLNCLSVFCLSDIVTYDIMIRHLLSDCLIRRAGSRSHTTSGITL